VLATSNVVDSEGANTEKWTRPNAVASRVMRQT